MAEISCQIYLIKLNAYSCQVQQIRLKSPLLERCSETLHRLIIQNSIKSEKKSIWQSLFFEIYEKVKSARWFVYRIMWEQKRDIENQFVLYIYNLVQHTLCRNSQGDKRCPALVFYLSFSTTNSLTSDIFAVYRH